MKKNLLVASFLICATTSIFADDSFTWTGYMRAGTGYNSDMSQVSAYDVANTGRFGNEYDTYIATNFNKKLTLGSGEWAEYSLGFDNWDYSLNRSSTMAITTNYLRMGGFEFLPETSSIWIGKRAYKKNVSILDYKNKNLAPGTGIGYESKQLDLGLFTGDGGTGSTENTYNTLDASIRYKNAEVELTYTKAEKDAITTGYADAALSGAVSYKTNTFFGLKGYSTYMAQVGKGVDYNKLNFNKVSSSNDDKAMKLTYDGKINQIENWEINPVFQYKTTDWDSSSKETEKRAVGGFRATNLLNKNFSMIYEVIGNHVENKNGTSSADGNQYKIAAGPALQLSSGFLNKPIMRLSLTYIGGDKEVTDLDGTGETSEVRIGYQFETGF